MSLLLDSAGVPISSGRSFSTDAGIAGFHRLDIAAARVLVKRLVRSGLRKGPSDMLLISDSALEQWYDEDAVAYLHEKATEAKKARGVIEVR